MHTDGQLPGGLGSSMGYTPGPAPGCQTASAHSDAAQELTSAENASPIRELMGHRTPPPQDLRTSSVHLHRGPNRYSRESVPTLTLPPAVQSRTGSPVAILAENRLRHTLSVESCTATPHAFCDRVRVTA